MTSPIIVLEGPRLSGKTWLADHIWDLVNHPHETSGNRIKDLAFTYSKSFDFVDEEFESFIIGKDVALAQRLRDEEFSVLTDRFMLTTAVYSNVFRNFPESRGEDYLKRMTSLIAEHMPDLKERLHYYVLIPERPEMTLKGTLGRENKDGLKDSVELLERQARLYMKYAKKLEMSGFEVECLPTYHTNPQVLDTIMQTIEWR